ncbi:DUF4760 domain-containing protein [candidate division KSB1 bacterium]|nr:DUF4760 domain-containing protein [candidate division KSB1 bacterium]
MDIKDLLDVGTFFSSVAAAIGLILVAWQTRETRKARQLQATIAIFDDLGSEDSRSSRQYVYTKLPDLIENYNDDDKYHVQKVIASLNRAALFCNTKHVNKEIIFAMYGESFVKCWNKLSGFIRERRKISGMQYASQFEYAAKNASKYWKL